MNIHHEPNEHRGTVLVVDDDAVCRKFCVQVLKHAGICARPSGSARHAFRQLRRFCPTVILIDLHLPDMTACTFLSRLRLPDLPATAQPQLLGMTGDDSPRAHQALHDAGCAQVLQKPFSATQLLASLRPAIHVRGGGARRENPQAPASGGAGSRHRASEIKRLFAAELGRDITTLDTLISALQWTSARQILHRLCGAAAIAGDPLFATHCRQLLRLLNAPGPTTELASSYFDFRRQAHMILRRRRPGWQQGFTHCE